MCRESWGTAGIAPPATPRPPLAREPPTAGSLAGETDNGWPGDTAHPLCHPPLANSIFGCRQCQRRARNAPRRLAATALHTSGDRRHRPARHTTAAPRARAANGWLTGW